MTSLSAGLVIYDILSKSDDVKATATRVFPVAADNAKLPYVAYRCAGLETTPQKKGVPGADALLVEVGCYAADYSGVVALSEAVRAALDFTQATLDGLVLRSCILVGMGEGWEDDAYVRMLSFEIRI